ncbi:NAC domain-containing protein 2 [Prunus yedoensis var. nudiflora]|uniref:NAC domain-containing protein 2 n=1 Tax=Prunus yedoensis var. nudiflora TaxID=2094558 RepID=A0A314Z445_PRUYE|nr:NAC domain-containing protein 2 [Prunus yedoensis var. nudiflora]
MRDEVPKINLYGTSEPWKIWKDFGGDGLEIGEDLYFFTTLKTKGTRVSRKAGNGCWHGENSAKVLDPKNEQKVLGFSRRFHYKNPKSDQNGCWIMHEYSLKDYPSMPKSKNPGLVMMMAINWCCAGFERTTRSFIRMKGRENLNLPQRTMVLMMLQ